MKYYVVADVHGFFKYFKIALKNAGFFDDKEPHKLIVCGDLFDRGREAVEMQSFILDLMDKGEVILVRGNHEDLFVDMIDKGHGIPFNHHLMNGTYDTALQLTGFERMQAYRELNRFVENCRNTPFYQKIIPSMVDYYETDHYIFVHGWIPMIGSTLDGDNLAKYLPGWRKATPQLWSDSRWENGMAASLTVREEGKTIVCGHWNCSYGHYNIDFSCDEEFGKGADHTTFYGKGVIALDACTVESKMVNCIVIND